MLFYTAAFLLISLSTSVQNEICASDATLANQLREASASEEIDWDVVVAEMRAGIDEGLEEGRRHHEDSAHLPEAEREEAHESFRDKLIARFRPTFWAAGPVDYSRIVFAVASIASGVVTQFAYEASGQLGSHFDSDPLLGCTLSTAYLFAMQGLVTSLTLPLERSALPQNLRGAPAPALLGGVFSSLSIATAVIGLPKVGFGLGSLVIVSTQISMGLALDATGFFGYAAKRHVNKKQLLGLTVMASGLLTSLGDKLKSEGAEALVSALPFFGLVAFRGVAGPFVSITNGALAPFAGSSLRAATISFFVGVATMMVVSILVSLVDHSPAPDFAGLEWWNWTGGVLNSYTMWAHTFLPTHLGLSAHFSLNNLGYTGASTISEVFGKGVPLSKAKALGQSLCVIGMILVQLFAGAVIEPSQSTSGPVIEELGTVEIPPTTLGRGSALDLENVDANLEVNGGTSNQERGSISVLAIAAGDAGTETGRQSQF